MATTQPRSIGKVVQVAGPAVDCEFPEGQIPLIHTAIRITSEGFNVPDAHRHHLRSAAAHRRRPRAHHRAAAHRRHGPRHEGRSAWATRWKCRSVRRRWAACSTSSASRWTRWARSTPRSASPFIARRPRFEEQSTGLEMFETGIKVDRPSGTLSARRQDRPVRRRRRRQDRHHHGADQQHRHEARRRLGVRRRGRAHPRRQRSLARNAGIGRHRSARLHQVQSAP